MKKILAILSIVSFLFIVKSPAIALNDRYCNFSPTNANGQPYGDVTFTTSCVIYEAVNGTANGNLTLQNTAITVNRKLVFPAGKQINVGSGSYMYLNSGGSIVQRKLCVKDADADGYADTIVLGTDPANPSVPLANPITQIGKVEADAAGTCPTGYRLSELMNNLAMVDANTASADSTFATSDYEFLRLGFSINGMTDAAAAVGDIIVPSPKNLIVAGGSVGIKTTSPQRKLHITSLTDAGSNSIFQSDADGRAGIVIRDQYPAIDIVSNYPLNANHGATLGFVAYDAALTGWGRWVMGTSGLKGGLLSIGYAADSSNPHYGIGWGWGGDSYTKMTLDTSGNMNLRWGNLNVAGTVTAPIFYDSNNTAKYVDPNSVSYLTYLNTANDTWLPYSGNGWNYIRGNSYINNATWYDENDSAYYMDLNGSSRFNYFGRNYGWNWTEYDWNNIAYYMDLDQVSILNDLRVNILYDRQNTGYYVVPRSTSRMNEVQADRVYGFADIRSPIFYDYNDTGYYVDPNSYSRLSRAMFGSISTYGQTDWGPQVSIRRDGPVSAAAAHHGNLQLEVATAGVTAVGIAFHRAGYFGANFVLDTDNWFSTQGWSAGGGYTSMRVGNLNASGYVYASSYVQSAGAVYGTIYYDQNNTGYYVNPDGSSRMVDVYANGLYSYGATTTYSYQGNGNVGGTGAAGWFPSGIYSAGHNWLYGGASFNGGSLNSTGNINLNGGAVIVNASYLNVWSGDRHFWIRDYEGTNRFALRTTDGYGHGMTWVSNWKDLAENMQPGEGVTLEAGDMVMANGGSRNTIAKTNSEYNSQMIGVISTQPGLLMNQDVEDKDKRGKPVSLAGRVPAKVSIINGIIKIGDPITSSPIAGVAMKATKVGRIIGYAMENYPYTQPQGNASLDSMDGTVYHQEYSVNGQKVGKISIFVNPSWYDPDVYLTSAIDLKITGDDKNGYTVKKQSSAPTFAEATVDKVGAFAELVVAKIQAGLIETKKLVVDGVDILKKLNELSNKVDSQQKQIDTLIKSVDELKNRSTGETKTPNLLFQGF